MYNYNTKKSKKELSKLINDLKSLISPLILLLSMMIIKPTLKNQYLQPK